VVRAFARLLTLAPAEAEDAVAALQAHLSDAGVYDAVAAVGLLNLAIRSVLATGSRWRTTCRGAPTLVSFVT
jgi:hypothetical protein